MNKIAIKNFAIWARNKLIADISYRAGLVGHYRYYGVSFNSRWIANFWFQTRELLFKILNRRSNRRSYTRAEFVDMLKYYPLATPKVYVSLFQ